MTVSCAVKRQQTTDLPQTVLQFIEEKGDANVSYFESPDKQHILCLYIRESNTPVAEYVVYSVADNSEVYRSGFIGRSIKWLNNEELIIAGTSRVDANASTVINIHTEESRAVSDKY